MTSVNSNSPIARREALSDPIEQLRRMMEIRFVEERIQMAIPMKPLCREDCLGLCAQCCADRNVSPCDCAVEFIDPRWKALELLKKGQV